MLTLSLLMNITVTELMLQYVIHMHHICLNIMHTLFLHTELNLSMYLTFWHTQYSAVPVYQ